MARRASLGGPRLRLAFTQTKSLNMLSVTAANTTQGSPNALCSCLNLCQAYHICVSTPFAVLSLFLLLITTGRGAVVAVSVDLWIGISPGGNPNIKLNGTLNVPDTPNVSTSSGAQLFGLTEVNLSTSNGLVQAWDRNELDLIASKAERESLGFEVSSTHGFGLSMEVWLPLPDGLGNHSFTQVYSEWLHWRDAPQLGELEVTDLEVLMKSRGTVEGGGTGVGTHGWDSWKGEFTGSGFVTDFTIVPEPSSACLLVVSIVWIRLKRRRTAIFPQSGQ